jgi:hypothetical protein
MKGPWKGWFGSLVPGIITVAVVFGPSKVTIASKLGAQYGSSLLWVIVLTIFFMAIYTNMAARIGIATHKSLLTTIREKWGNAGAGLNGSGNVQKGIVAPLHNPKFDVDEDPLFRVSSALMTYIAIKKLGN